FSVTESFDSSLGVGNRRSGRRSPISRPGGGNDGKDIDDREVSAQAQVQGPAAQPVQHLWPAARLHAQVRPLSHLLPRARAAWRATRRDEVELVGDEVGLEEGWHSEHDGSYRGYADAHPQRSDGAPHRDDHPRVEYQDRDRQNPEG